MLISSLPCWCSGDNHVDLSTPEKTLRSYYEGFKRSDFEYQKKTLLSSIQPIGKEIYDVVSPILETYEIVKMGEAKNRKDDTFRFLEGDMEAIVKEIYKNKQESEIYYILRKFDGKWLIIEFDLVSDPPGSRIIEEKATKMLEHKGKK
jgi:hypothetical protein